MKRVLSILLIAALALVLLTACATDTFDTRGNVSTTDDGTVNGRGYSTDDYGYEDGGSYNGSSNGQSSDSGSGYNNGTTGSGTSRSRNGSNGTTGRNGNMGGSGASGSNGGMNGGMGSNGATGNNGTGGGLSGIGRDIRRGVRRAEDALDMQK